MSWPRMEGLDLSGLRVLIREDLNAPVRDGEVANDARIRAALPTIRRSLKTARRTLIMSHLGRPREGAPASSQPAFSLRPVARRLERLLGRPVPLAEDYLDDPDGLAGPGPVLLENVRFNAGEAADDAALAGRYAALCDVFVMDAFGAAHRAQASTHGVIRLAPRACAGPLLAAELDGLERALSRPERPLLAIVGGAKVSGKLAALERLAELADHLIVGGGIANTFLLAGGAEVGASLCERDMVDAARRLMDRVDIPLPVDVRTAAAFEADAAAAVRPAGGVAPGEMILDIGPETERRYARLIAGMKTIVWNGPPGVFEFDNFAEGTRRVAEAVAASGAFSIAGGGETIAALDRFGVSRSISLVSTGGGAFLECVRGAELPAVAMLRRRGREAD